MRTHHNIYIGDNREALKHIDTNSIDLIVTSPPYSDLKNYGNEPNQIGYGQTYEDYLRDLEHVFTLCYSILKPNRRLCINVGDVFFTKNKDTVHKILPVGADIIHILCKIGFGYCGDIIWSKYANGKGAGGSTVVMGSFPYPYSGLIQLDYEHIIVAYKPESYNQKDCKIDKDVKEISKLSTDEWKRYFDGIWHINGDRQNDHPAKFPIEIPKRLIKMFSFVGDVILDPFLGSGTTSIAAKMLDRNSIGIELHDGYKEVIRRKIHDSALSKLLTPCEVNFHVV